MPIVLHKVPVQTRALVLILSHKPNAHHNVNALAARHLLSGDEGMACSQNFIQLRTAFLTIVSSNKKLSCIYTAFEDVADVLSGHADGKTTKQ